MAEDSHLHQMLAPDEVIHVEATAQDARLVVTDRRVIVAGEARTAMALPIEELRRNPVRHRAHPAGDARDRA